MSRAPHRHPTQFPVKDPLKARMKAKKQFRPKNCAPGHPAQFPGEKLLPALVSSALLYSKSSALVS